MKGKLLATIITIMIATTTVSAATVVTYESCDLTTEILCTRAERHEIIIEKIIGVCLDDEGNGQILNPWDEDHDFISYASIPSIREWDDDVIERCDFVIDAGVEVGEEE